MRIFMHFLILSMLWMFTSAIALEADEHISRGVVSAGAGLVVDSNNRISALLGQSVVGSASARGEYLHLGFYSRAKWLPVLVHRGTDSVPARFFLAQNYPNPFNATTVIEYSIEQTGPVRLKIFDVLGREVATCVDAVLTAGPHRLLITTDHLPTGVYYFVLESASSVAKRKGLLLK
ncbi:MAG TPA: T9SS type A sorting domain-containing protein [bacterium]|nr:T9SS type A sorting domain-containing protein [bacterium]HPG44922.1 T9SS type A sorting domain-containing protein [bacterium]HPM98049.1 T9SS type A sorting domain-containing protein [bacterium]